MNRIILYLRLVAVLFLGLSTFVYGVETVDAPITQGDQCPRNGPGVLRYDLDPFTYDGVPLTIVHNSSLKMSQEAGLSDIRFYSLFSVPSYPYLITTLCVYVGISQTIPTRIQAYKVKFGSHFHIEPNNDDGPFYATLPFAFPTYQPDYISFDMDDINGNDTFVVPYKHFFGAVTVDLVNSDLHFFLNEANKTLIENDPEKWLVIEHQLIRPCYAHYNNAGFVMDIPYTGPFSVSVALAGKPINPQDTSKWSNYMLKAWKCNYSSYGDGKVCDCDCGLPDPDCDIDGMDRTCHIGLDEGICHFGECKIVSWNKNKCPVEKYGDGKECDCGCSDDGSVVDPDCQLPGMERVCRGVRSSCVVSPYNNYLDAKYGCTPDEWKCEFSRFGDGYCDCGTCSDTIIDPDCLYLNPNTSCGSMYCVNFTCEYPQNWTCPPEYYNDHKYCDCGCGVYDPDCYLRNSTLRGCPENDGNVYTCQRVKGKMETVCAAAMCGNNLTEPAAGEECDGGEGCDENCKCVKGYVAPSYAARFCVTVCGDGIVAGEEECDSSAFCDPVGCVCMQDHELNKDYGVCRGCGNGVVEEGEECDSGDGCSNVTCTCLSGYKAVNSTYCVNTNVDTVVGASVGSVLGAFLLCALIFGILYYVLVYSRKYATSIELSSMDNTPLNADSFVGVLATDESLWKISPKVLNFGFKHGNLAPIGVTHNAKVVLTNSSEYKMNYQVLVPKSNKYSLNASSVNGTVNPNGTVAIDFDLMLFCTTKIRTSVTFSVDYDKSKHEHVRERREMKVRVEGQVSTHIDIDELQFEAPIGEGQCSCGVVNRGKWREHDVAIKVLPYVNDRVVTDFLHEVEVMESLQSDYLVKFYGGAMSSDRMCLVTQFMYNGNLSQFLTHYQLSPYMKIRIAHDIAAGMAFLHYNHLIHRNLKPTNVLIASRDPRERVLCKISDFGASRFISDSQAAATMTSLTVTPLYTAPEMMVENGKYSMASDVFSFGIILAEIWNEFLPYSETSFDTPFALSRYIIQGNRPGLRSDCPQIYASLAQACWVTDPSQRPTFEQIVATLESKEFAVAPTEPLLVQKSVAY